MTMPEEDQRPMTFCGYKNMTVWFRGEPNAHGLLHCHQMPDDHREPQKLFAGYLSRRQLKRL